MDLAQAESADKPVEPDVEAIPIQTADRPNVPRIMPVPQVVTQSLSSLTFAADASESVYNEQTETLAGIYKLKQKIGSGTYGIVKVAEDIRQLEKNQYAVKILHKADMTDNKHVVRVRREIRFLRLLHHPHIVKVRDVFESPKSLFIVMERFTGGELFDYIVNHGRVKEKESRRFFRQIISAVEYCHQNSVIHRDLKPENLLLDEARNIKLIDLGFANHYKQSQLLETHCGSPNYAAPEMIKGEKYNGPEVDIWSLGIILYALVCGHLPFEDKSPRRLLQKIVKGEYPEPLDVSSDCQNMISRLLDIRPPERAKLSEVAVHKWIMTGYDEPINSYVPHRRPIDVKHLNEQVMIKLRQFGYTNEEILANIGDASLNPIMSTYHLINELLDRNKLAQQETRSPHYIYSPQEDPISRRMSSFTISIPNMPSEPSKSSLQIPEVKQSSVQSIVQQTPRKFSVLIPRPPPVILNGRRGSEFPAKPTESISPSRSPTELNMVTEPRLISGWFVTYSTTSTKEPQNLVSSIVELLNAHQIEHVQEGWILDCLSRDVRFNIEIVRVIRLGLCGMIFSRISGGTVEYREICGMIQRGVADRSHVMV